MRKSLSIGLIVFVLLFAHPATAQTPPLPPSAPGIAIGEAMQQAFHLGVMVGQQFQGRITEMQTKLDQLTKELAATKEKCGTRCEPDRKP